MVQWQSDLRVSWRAQWLSLLIHGLVAVFILLMPWPLSYTPLWLVLLSLVVFDSVRSQRRINACQGEIRLLMDGRLRWQGQEWSIVCAPWMIKTGMMLRLRSDAGKRQHLWLAADSMDDAEWRDLRRLMQAGEGIHAVIRQTGYQDQCSAISPRICSHHAWIRSSLRSYWFVSSRAKPTNNCPSAITGLSLVNS